MLTHVSPLRRTVLALLTALIAVLAPAMAASAHNSFDSSDPADGATLEVAPTEISLVFANDVPLDSATVTLVDPTGSRTEIVDLSHGPAGQNVVVAPLPVLPPGESTVRWSLVSDDGHVVSGRVRMSVTAPTTDTTDVTDTTDTTPTVSPPTTSPSDAESADQDGTGAPDAVRWLLRYLSYVAIAVVIGLALVERLVWAGAAQVQRLRTASSVSLLLVGLLALVQLFVLAADVEAAGGWLSLSGVDRALTTDAGVALLARVALALGAWLVLHRMVIGDMSVRSTAVAVVGTLLLGTWAWAGHAQSQRWPLVGVLTDVVHHGAAALWLAALAVVGFVALPAIAPGEAGTLLRRLSDAAGIAVGAIVVTGVVQSVRLVGNPADLFSGPHSVLLLAKVAVVAVMIGLGRVNRTRVEGLARGGDAAGTVAAVRTAVIVEAALGLLVLALTASLVVASPAVAG